MNVEWPKFINSTNKPEGAFTLSEFQEHFKLKRWKAKQELRRMVEGRKVEMLPGWGPSGLKYYRTIPNSQNE